MKKNHIWVQAWTAEQPLFKHYAQVERLILYRDIVSNVPPNILFYSENSVVRMYVTEESYELMQEDGKKLLDPKVAGLTVDDIELTVKNFWVITEEIRKEILKRDNLKNLDFVKLIKTFDSLVIKIFAYFSATWEAASYFPEERLKELLKITFPEDWESKFTLLITTSDPDLLLREKISWLKVLKNPTKENVKIHMLDFPFLFGNIDSEEDAYEIMTGRIDKDSIEEIEEEIKKTQKRLIENKKLQSEIFEKTNSKEVETLSFLFQRFSLLRLELKDCWQGIHYYLFPLYSYIFVYSGNNQSES